MIKTSGKRWRARTIWLAVATVISLVIGVAPNVVGAVTPPTQDSFYKYTGHTALAKIKPGTVLKTRTVSYHVLSIPLPLTVTQLLFRTTNQLGQPSVAVTSVVHAPGKANPNKALSYESFYDSLNPADEPSYTIEGGLTLGGGIPDVETTLFASFLLQGYSVNIPDTQGENADFADGPEYGIVTLDSLRAASSSPRTGLNSKTKFALIGYSGGAIATGWASALAPTYAPDVNRRLIGTAEGGILVDPAHNLHYISGSLVWAGVLVMALIGIARGFHIDLSPYLNSYGKSLYKSLASASITTVLGAYPGLTWQEIAKPGIAEPEDIPIYAKVANKLDLGNYGSPTVPMFMGQGANGILEGTSGNQPGIGAGDGVMVAGDVRTLARKYCASGDKVEFTEYDGLSHTTTVALWLPAALSWLSDRFAGKAAPQNCSSIAKGNSLTLLPTP